MKVEVKVESMIEILEGLKFRGAWEKGVKDYAIELLEQSNKIYLSYPEAKTILLNGARDWFEYSYGGCSLIYNGDIAKRLCTSGQLKKTHEGLKNPNSRETWLDVQARALSQAYGMIVTYCF